MANIPSMRSDNSEILPYNFKDYFVFIGIEKLSDHPNFSMFNHWHEAVELIVPIHGHMIYNVNGNLINLDPNNGIFVNSNQIHYGFSYDNTDCVFIYALWHPLLLCATNGIENEYVQPITKNSSLPFISLNSEVNWQNSILSDVHEMNRLLANKAAPLILQSTIYKIWYTIYVNTNHGKRCSVATSPQLSILKDMLSFVHESYGEKITLHDIADAGKISISSCNILFKKYLMDSPVKYLLSYRLMKSSELLTETTLSITEIAFEVGFSNPSYFIDSFKREYGCTPNEYRKEHKSSEIFNPYFDL